MSLRKYQWLVSAVAVGTALVGIGCSSSSGGSVTPPKDAGKDTNQPPPTTDSGLPDVNIGDVSSADAPACAPASVSGFTPVTIAPLVAPVCDTTTANNVLQNCIIGQNQTACEATLGDASSAASDCFNCIETLAFGITDAGVGEITSTVPAFTSPQGAAIFIPWAAAMGSGIINLNQGGCLATADSSFASCGTASNNLFQCEVAACGASCPVSSDATLTDFENCTTAADNGACMSYVTAANTACASVPDGGEGTAAAPCFGNIDFTSATEPALLSFVMVQCGGADGG